MDSDLRSRRNMRTVLILGEDSSARRKVGRYLDGSALVLEASGGEEGMDLLARGEVDVVILVRGRRGDSRQMEDRGPLDIDALRAAAGDAVLVEIASEDESAFPEHAAASGLWDVIGAGRDPEEIRHRVARAAEHSRLRRELSRLQADMDDRFGAGSLLGSSPVMERLRHRLRRIGREDAPVLLCGEKGTGRERAARALHMSSARRQGPFGTVSPGGMDSMPLRVLPEGGTLLIRDINEFRASPRTRLLRELAAARGKVRLVAAVVTSEPRQEVSSPLTRELAPLGRPMRIDLPPLRERRGDVALLASHFLEKYREAHGRPLRSISLDAAACMEAYPWPGNVRELEDLVESMVLLAGSATLQVRHLPPHLQQSRSRHALVMPAIPEEGVMWQRQVESFQRGLLEQALTLSSGKKVDAARRLGLKKDQMKYLCRKYGL